MREELIYFKVFKSSIQFSTLTLSTLSDKLKKCCNDILMRTNQTISRLRMQLKTTIVFISTIIHSISTLDMLFALTFLAQKNPVFSRPFFSPGALSILRLEQLLDPLEFRLGKESYASSQNMNAQDYFLFDGSPLEVVIGNSRHEQLYLPRLALAVVLSQVGSFVPCNFACLPIFSSIHSKLSLTQQAEKLASHLKTELWRLEYTRFD